MNLYTDWTMEELLAEDARFAEETNTLDEQLQDIRRQMRDLQQAADPLRLEIQRRRREHADNDPNTQAIGLYPPQE